MTSATAAVSYSPSPSLASKKSAAVTMSHLPAVSPGSRSNLTRHPTLPPIGTTSPAPQPPGEEREETATNPFLMPPESELFTLREKQRRQAKVDRAQQRQLKVHEKSTYTSRLNSKTASLRKKVMMPPEPKQRDSERDEREKGERGVSEDTDFVLTTTRDRHLEKEDITSYVNRKREMFLVQYALGVKRDEIRKLEDIARAEEQKLEAAEKYLKESAEMFDEFVKENDRNASEAVRMSEAATKSKLEKTAEIKRLNSLLVTVRNEISRNNETLAELQQYHHFLDRLAPQEWREQREAKREFEKPLKSSAGEQAAENEDRKCREEEEEAVPAELYFTAPAQLVRIFSELEEQNLSLIQNGQETEETLEELRQTRKDMERKLDTEIHNLKRQVGLLTSAIEREEAKASDLEMKSKLLSYGEYRAEDQEHMLTQLDKRVAEVYTKSIGPNEANISSLHMLTAIEECIEALFETIESLPPDKVEAAEKVKEKEHRMRARAQKLEDQRLQQELRLRRMQERAQGGPKIRMGRKLVYRSEPPVLKRKQKESKAQKEKEEEEMQYFFS